MYVVRSNRRFWQAADYLWLTIAATGLVTASGAARRFLAQQSRWVVEGRLQSCRSDVDFWVNNSIKAFGEYDFSQWEASEDATVCQHEYEALAAWYGALGRRLKENPNSRPWRELHRPVSDPGAFVHPMLQSDERHFDAIVARFEEASGVAENHARLLDQGLAEQVTVVISP